MQATWLRAMPLRVLAFVSIAKKIYGVRCKNSPVVTICRVNSNKQKEEMMTNNSIVRRIVGYTLLMWVWVMVFSSCIYCIVGDDKWFSRMVFAIITLGLWYAGTPERDESYAKKE